MTFLVESWLEFPVSVSVLVLAAVPPLSVEVVYEAPVTHDYAGE